MLLYLGQWQNLEADKTGQGSNCEDTQGPLKGSGHNTAAISYFETETETAKHPQERGWVNAVRAVVYGKVHHNSV